MKGCNHGVADYVSPFQRLFASISLHNLDINNLLEKFSIHWNTWKFLRSASLIMPPSLPKVVFWKQEFGKISLPSIPLGHNELKVKRELDFLYPFSFLSIENILSGNKLISERFQANSLLIVWNIFMSYRNGCWLVDYHKIIVNVDYFDLVTWHWDLMPENIESEINWIQHSLRLALKLSSC